jgi:hypothetical protein
MIIKHARADTAPPDLSHHMAFLIANMKVWDSTVLRHWHVREGHVRRLDRVVGRRLLERLKQRCAECAREAE